LLRTSYFRLDDRSVALERIDANATADHASTLGAPPVGQC
jgi:hypothetical protein